MSYEKSWDPLIRLFHWATAIAFFINYGVVEDGPWHNWIGYGVGVLLVVRVFWGVFGSENARFSACFPAPKRIKEHVRRTKNKEKADYPGHNPIGALMVIALLVNLFGLVLTGWFMELDTFNGVQWPQEVHEFFADLIFFLVAIHIAVILYYDLVLKKGLIWSMIKTGHG